MDVNFHVVYDDLSEQSGTITLEEVAELLAHLIAKHLIAQAKKQRIARNSKPTNQPIDPS